MSYAGRSPTSFITRRSASRTDHLLQRRATIVAVEAAEELHQLDDQLGARVDRRRFEQRLLRRRAERRALRATVDHSPRAGSWSGRGRVSKLGWITGGAGS